MSRNVVGTKPQSSGWWGSKSSSSGGAIVLNALATPAPLASCARLHRRLVGDRVIGVEGILRGVREDDVRLDLADQVGEPVDCGRVQHERIVAEIEGAEAGTERGGGGLGLRVTDLLDPLLGLPGLLPELARLAALAVRERDDLRRPARCGDGRDRAGRTPDEVGGMGADDEKSA